MALIDWLRGKAAEPAGPGKTDTVRRIVKELDRLDPVRARYLAAFAYVLSRVASADLHISDVETEKIVEIVMRIGHLPDEQAVLVVEIAKNQNRMFGGTENFLVTREFRDLATDAQRAELLDCLFAVSAADDAITGEEENQVWQIASELGFSHPEYIAARLLYSDKRTGPQKEVVGAFRPAVCADLKVRTTTVPFMRPTRTRPGTVQDEPVSPFVRSHTALNSMMP